MLPSPPAASSSPPTRPLSAWLAGRIDWPGYAALAERLAGEAARPAGRHPTLVVFELAPCITIGRRGSRIDVAIDDDELRSRQLPVRFTGRGGGAVVHGPGQVCVSLFAALADLGLGPHDVGAVLQRFEAGLAAALRALKAGPIRHPGSHGIFGRTGLLAAVGVAVRRGAVAHGAFVNVSPALDLHHRVTTLRLPLPEGGVKPVTMGSVEADIQRMVRLPDARTALVQHLADAFGFEQTHIQSGFPVVPPAAGPAHPEFISRVG
ncbi:MAG: lipoyl protein ligase domain-containing protein [Planctomycetota bacterium]